MLTHVVHSCISFTPPLKIYTYILTHGLPTERGNKGSGLLTSRVVPVAVVWMLTPHHPLVSPPNCPPIVWTPLRMSSGGVA